MSSLAVVASPVAGRGHAPRLAAATVAALRADGHTVRDLTGSTAAGTAARLAAALPGLDAVVGVGGDGVVHLLAQHVAGTTVALALVPAGTGNDVARALGVPVGDAAAALGWVRAAVGRTPRRVDALRVRDATGRERWCVAAVATGFDAAVNRRANAMRHPRGRARYLLAVAGELPRLAARRCTVTVDGVAQTHEAVLVTVANTPSYGGGLRIAPQASVDDGRLDVVVVGPVGRAELARMLPSLRSGTHVRHPAVTTGRGRVVEVAVDVEVDAAVHGAGVPAQAFGDGEPVGPLPLRCTVVAGALRVLAPPPPTAGR